MKSHIGFNQNAFFKGSGVRQGDWLGLSSTFCITGLTHKGIQRRFQACTQAAAAAAPPAPHLPGTDRRLFSHRAEKKRTRIELQILNEPGLGGWGVLKGFFFFFILVIFLHSWFNPVPGPSAASRLMVAFSSPHRDLAWERSSSGIWHKTGPLALCAFLLLGGTFRRSTGSPFTPTTVIRHACTNALSEY